MEFLLKEVADVNIRGNKVKIRTDEERDGMMALHVAALWGHTETVKLLVADRRTKEIIPAKTKLGETALHLAVRNHDDSCENVLEALKNLINSEVTAALKKNSKAKWTALHAAAENGNSKGARKLLKLGARSNAKNENDDTALHLAARRGSKDIVEALLQEGAKANERNRWKAQPLHEVIQNLVNRGPDGRVAAIEEMTETAKTLISHDRALDSSVSSYGDNALHLAAKVGNAEIVVAVHDRDQNLVNTKNHDKKTALHSAARADFIKIVRVLVNQADLTAIDSNGRTPGDVATGESADYLETYG